VCRPWVYFSGRSPENGCQLPFWSAAFQRRFLSFSAERLREKKKAGMNPRTPKRPFLECGVSTPLSFFSGRAAARKKESGDESPHSKTTL
jgi:hypothetical protein